MLEKKRMKLLLFQLCQEKVMEKSAETSATLEWTDNTNIVSSLFARVLLQKTHLLVVII